MYFSGSDGIKSKFCDLFWENFFNVDNDNDLFCNFSKLYSAIVSGFNFMFVWSERKLYNVWYSSFSFFKSV